MYTQEKTMESPWEKLIPCTNCGKFVHRLTICKLFGWKEVYLCIDCYHKFRDSMEKKGLSEKEQNLRFHEVKIMYQNAKK